MGSRGSPRAQIARCYDKLFVFLKPDRVTGQNEQDLRRGFKAHWLSFNPAIDLALLLIDGAPAGLPTIPLADSDVGVGEATAAIGHPEHGARWSLTTGRIGGEWASFEGVAGKDVYQMETSVNRGNSGGPLLDGNGYMVGINTAIARRSEDGLAITGVNFAIKSSVVRRWLGDTMSQVETKKTKRSEPPPPPQQVAAAEPPPLEPERTEAPPQDEQADRIAAPARPGKATLAPPAPPPEGKRGFVSSEPPGKTLTPLEAARWHARKAFDDLDEEEQKHQTKKAGSGATMEK